MDDTAAASFIGVAMGGVQFRSHGRSSERAALQVISTGHSPLPTIYLGRSIVG